MYKLNNVKGITLIELMVVIAVLAIISAIAIPAYRGYIKTSYRTDCYNEVAAIQLAEEEFFLENNNYFIGGDVATLQANSAGSYIPSAEAAAGTAQCTYSVAVAGNTYTITATGANKLNGEGVITTKSN